MDLSKWWERYLETELAFKEACASINECERKLHYLKKELEDVRKIVPASPRRTRPSIVKPTAKADLG